MLLVSLGVDFLVDNFDADFVADFGADFEVDFGVAFFSFFADDASFFGVGVAFDFFAVDFLADTPGVVFDFFAGVFFTGEGDLEREAEAAACCDRFVPLGLEAVKSAIFEYSKWERAKK